MELISVVIITYNEEANIGRCIDAVQPVADEIIVLDAYSGDKTMAIAKSKGAIVEQGYFLGHIQQKNAAMALASNNFILSLDADEAPDEILLSAVRQVKMAGLAGAYSMNRCTNYCGKYIRKGTWYPDKKIRLFDKRTARWGGDNPHDKIVTDDLHAKVQHLQGDILHYSFPTIERHIEKNNTYSTIAARTLHARGKKSSWFKILINPLWAFVHCYIIRLGFTDGFYGFIIAVNTAHGTFLKYIKLYHLQHAHKKPVFVKAPGTATITMAEPLNKVNV